MCGAMAQYLSLAFIIEEGMRMEDFWIVLNGIKSAADRAGIRIVTGDTKVVEKGKGDQIFINTSGIGIIHPKPGFITTELRQEIGSSSVETWRSMALRS